VTVSDSTASEPRSLDPNPDACMPLSTSDWKRLQETHSGLWADPEITCLTCEKQGEFRTIRDGQEVSMWCDCVEQWKLHLWMLNAGIGLAYQRLGWEQAEGVSDQALVPIDGYLREVDVLSGIGHGLTLWGPPGTGKTLLLTLIQRKLMELGFDTYFILFNQLVNLHTAGWRDDGARRYFERRVMNAEHLFIDDMGKENSNRGEIVGSLVDEILRHRIQHGRTTFVSANLSPETMEDRYYTGTLGLFQEVNRIIEIQGESFREHRRELLANQARRGIRWPVVIG
jgi:DNA replication protein DnaC